MVYLYVAALCATLFGYASPFINIAAPFFFYFAVKDDTTTINNTPLFSSLMIFALWLLAVTLYWTNFLGMLAGIFAILPTVFLFFYAANILDSSKALRFLKVLVYLSLFSAPVALYQQYILKVSIFERAYATFGNANFYASYLLLIIPAAVSLALSSTNKKERIVFIAITLINIYCLFLTNSRTAITALLIAFLMFALLAKNYRLLIVSAAAVLSLVGAVLLKPDIIPRYNIIFEEFQERLSIWSLAWYAIKQHPLAGTGLTSFYTQYVMNYPGKYAPHAHNLFLNILVEGGLIGLGMLVWNLKKVYQIGITKIIHNKNILMIGLLVGITGALIHSLLDNPLENFQTGTIMALIVAILLRI